MNTQTTSIALICHLYRSLNEWHNQPLNLWRHIKIYLTPFHANVCVKSIVLQLMLVRKLFIRTSLFPAIVKLPFTNTYEGKLLFGLGVGKHPTVKMKEQEQTRKWKEQEAEASQQGQTSFFCIAVCGHITPLYMSLGWSTSFSSSSSSNGL